MWTYVVLVVVENVVVVDVMVNRRSLVTTVKVGIGAVVVV